MAKKKRIILLAFIFIFLSLSINACKPNWSITIQSKKNVVDFDRLAWDAIIKEYQTEDNKKGIDAEIVFYKLGYDVIEEIHFYTDTGEEINEKWEDIAGETLISNNGKLIIRDTTYSTEKIEIDVYEYLVNTHHITDIAPSISSALGITETPFASESLVSNHVSRVLLIIWDAFGWMQYQNAKISGQIPHLTHLAAAIPAITIYPPRTTTATAALITGLYPKENGVDRGGIRSTESDTILDILNKNDLEFSIIEGESSPFFYSPTGIILSGDRNQDGSTDDNVFENAILQIREDPVDFLLIHFHGIDDLGHEYGPDHYLVGEKISELDKYLLDIYKLIPEDSLIILTADHGMHSVQEEGRLGNHGNLIAKDMLTPIFLINK